MSKDTARDIAPATGKLGILMPGMGAVASTFMAGVIAAPPKETGRPKATRRARAWLGIKHQVVTPELAETLKLDVDIKKSRRRGIFRLFRS